MYLLGFILFLSFSVYGFICFGRKCMDFYALRGTSRVQEYKDRLKFTPEE